MRLRKATNTGLARPRHQRSWWRNGAGLILVSIVALLVTWLEAVPAIAQEPGVGGDPKSRLRYQLAGPLGDSFRDIASDIRCPTCAGLSVLDSDAQFSVQIKDIVKEQLEAGKSREEILGYFTERYGPWILRAPPARGFNVLAWGLPAAILLVGPLLLALLLRRSGHHATSAAPEAAVRIRPLAAILEQMDRELNQMRATSEGAQ